MFRILQRCSTNFPSIHLWTIYMGLVFGLFEACSGATPFNITQNTQLLSQGISNHDSIVMRNIQEKIFCFNYVPKEIQNAMSRSEEHTSELQSLMRITYDV